MALPHLQTDSSLGPSTAAVPSQMLLGRESNKATKADRCESFAFSLQLLKKCQIVHQKKKSPAVPQWLHDSGAQLEQ